MLQRMDANGNGLLEPSEVSERAKPFIDRAASAQGIDPSQPIPLDKLQAVRPEGENRSGGDSGSPGEQRSGEGTPGSGQSGPGQPGAAPQVQTPKPLVPGFGVQTAQTGVRGFGTAGTVTQPRAQAQQVAMASGATGDGRTDGRGGPGNGRRRDGRRSENGSETSGDSQPASSASDARPQRRRFRTAIERLPGGLPSWFSKTDQDADGQIMMHEWAKAWSEEVATEFARWDLDSDGIVTAEECLKVEPPSQDSGDGWGF